MYIFRIFRSSSYFKVNESRSRSQEQNWIYECKQIHTFARGPPSIVLQRIRKIHTSNLYAKRTRLDENGKQTE